VRVERCAEIGRLHFWPIDINAVRIERSVGHARRDTDRDNWVPVVRDRQVQRVPIPVKQAAALAEVRYVMAVDEPEPPVARRVSFTRTQGTAITFSWRVRVVLSTIPLLPLAVFLAGGLGFGPITWPFAVLTAFAAAVWWPHVWTTAPLPSEPASKIAIEKDSNDPVNLFTWPPTLNGASQPESPVE